MNTFLKIELHMHGRKINACKLYINEDHASTIVKLGSWWYQTMFLFDKYEHGVPDTESTV